MGDLKKQASWTLGSSLIAAILQVIQLAILARTLDTESLGVLAIVQVFIAIAIVFQDSGLSNFSIHKQDISKHQFSALYLFSFMLGCSVALITYFSAPVIAHFYHQAQISGLLELLSIHFVLLGASSLFQAELIKQFKQVLLAKIEITCRILSFIVTLSVLFQTTLGLTAVIIGLLSGSAFKLLLLWRFAPSGISPWHMPDFSILSSAWRYAYFQLLAQFINQLRTQADQLIIGKLLGMEMLGFYSLAKELILKPSRFIQPLIQRLVLPRFAKQQNSKTNQQVLFDKTVYFLSWGNCALYSLIALCSWPIVLILYGQDYSLTASLLSILSVFAMIRPIGAIFASMAQANGRTDIEFKWNIVAGFFMLLFITSASISRDVIFVALALSIVQVFLTLLAHRFFNHYLMSNIPLRSLTTLILPLSITASCAAAGYFITTIL